MKRFLSIFVIVLVCCLLVGVLVACGGSHTCVDTTNDHRCDICDKVLSTCSDTDNNHLCDICGNSLSDCIDNDKNHVCEICGETIITCVDDNANHNCDICNKELSTCLDENADNECDICGLTFELLDNDTYKITGYNGTASNLQIPSTILGKPVTIIGEGAFSDCTSLKGITIPNSVTSIEDSAFEYCFSLISVVIGDSVEHIGEEAFFSCGKLLEVYNLSSLNITKGSEENGYVGYPALDIYTSLDTPSKLSTDSDGYMIYTNGEEKLLVGYTGSEKELTLPSDIPSIYHYAFVNCFSQTRIVIGDDVTSIGVGAFGFCYSLTSVVIGDSVTSIGEDAFFYSHKLVEVYNLSSLNITKGSEENGYVGYYAKDIYTSLNTPSKLSTDENGYIIYTDGQTKSLVGYVGEETELTLPSGITEINQGAFVDCTSLTSVVIPDSVTSIGERAFYNCESLTSVKYTGTIDQWCGITFDGWNSNPLSNGAKLSLNGELVTELVIPNSITEIKDFAFNGCDSLTNVTIPDSVTSIGVYAFKDCDSLTVINYVGTKVEWDNIEKGYNWDSGNYTIYYDYEIE